jgi:CheY-like chemotaxis protein
MSIDRFPGLAVTAAGRTKSAAQPRRKGQEMTSARKILLIDDDQELLRAAHLRLRSAGFKTQSASDGVEGLRATAHSRPDAILLDVRMPRMDGLTMLRRLKQNPSTESIPVVMISASVFDEKRALDAGARFFLAKPYDGKKLLAAVEAAMAGTFIRDKADNHEQENDTADR